jgi:hypothetical protein
VPDPDTPVWGPPEVVVRTAIVLAVENAGLTAPGSGADVTDAGALKAWAFVASAICAAVATGTVRDGAAASLGTMSNAGSKVIPASPVITLTHPLDRVL